MEKITLTPITDEIVVNNGAGDGAVDLFCYDPDDAASRALGSLYVIGHRDSDSSNMGYMVSLIAALARREYYAQPTISAREAFAGTLRKANEVVEEFFRTEDVKLSVGILAIAGGQIMVSKLDKFKILLARDNQVIDIFSNVSLFSKEHTEKRRFSSIIHGSMQANDRLLAFVPTRAVVTRERNLKAWFLKLPHDEFAQRLTVLGREHASFATTMLHINISKSTQPAFIPSPQPPELQSPQDESEPSLITPTLTTHAQSQTGGMAPVPWSPRQQSTVPVQTEPAGIEAGEVPRLIPTEFSQGRRRTAFSRMLGRVRLVRLDGRGKAISLLLVAVLVTGAALGAKSYFIDSPQEQDDRQSLADIKTDIELANSKSTEGAILEARGILTRAQSALQSLKTSDKTASELGATIASTLDSLDHAQTAEPKLIASPTPDTDRITMATWSSSSQSYQVGGTTSDGVVWVATLENGSTRDRTEFGTVTAGMLVGWRSSVLAVDNADRSITRTVGNQAKTYVIPVQETILDAAEFGDSLYVLTDHTILKISDLDTEKPVTKRWLSDDDQLAPGSSRLFVNGSVYTMGHDGALTTYYKGKQLSHVTVQLEPSGTWKLIPWSDGDLAVAVGDVRRVYVIDPADGSIVQTLKVDSQLPFTQVSAGPDGSVLMLTDEGKLWQVK